MDIVSILDGVSSPEDQGYLIVESEALTIYALMSDKTLLCFVHGAVSHEEASLIAQTVWDRFQQAGLCQEGPAGKMKHLYFVVNGKCTCFRCGNTANVSPQDGVCTACGVELADSAHEMRAAAAQDRIYEPRGRW